MSTSPLSPDVARALSIEEWLSLLALENEAGRARFDEARRHLDPSARVREGIATGGLVVADTGAQALGRVAWRLEDRAGAPLGPEPSAGDPVVVYRKRAPDEAVRALVTRRTRRSLTLVFDEPPDAALESAELVVEREWDGKSDERLRQGLAALRTGRKRDAFWRGLVTGEEPPRPASPEPTSAFPDAVATGLNEDQQIALRRAMDAPDVFLVHGPPGTGKTEVLAAIAAAEIAAGGSVLACAASNAAVDNLVARLDARGLAPVRLGHPARVLPRVVDRTLEALVDAHPNVVVARKLEKEARELFRRADRAARQGRAKDRFAEARDARTEARRLLGEARTLLRRAEDDTLEGARVVCATLTGIGARLRSRRFTLLIVDEATQATVPATVLGLLKAERAVLAGDQNQLPPTILSVQANTEGLGRTLYERLVDTHGAAVSTMLRVQHRMNAHIMRFPSDALYGGALVAHKSVRDHALEGFPPVLFVDTAGKGWGEERPNESESVRNPDEAARVRREVDALVERGVSPSDIAVISPYAAQVQLLRQLISQEEVEVDTVDAFQGREKEAVVVSLTRSNDAGELGFVADVRRMNVAMTRARKRLVVIGDSATLGGHPFYEAFVAFTQASGFYRSAWEED